jgi:hypothetical protein
MTENPGDFNHLFLVESVSSQHQELNSGSASGGRFDLRELACQILLAVRKIKLAVHNEAETRSTCDKSIRTET